MEIKGASQKLRIEDGVVTFIHPRLQRVKAGEYPVAAHEIESVTVVPERGLQPQYVQVKRQGFDPHKKWRRDPYTISFIGAPAEYGDKVADLIRAVAAGEPVESDPDWIRKHTFGEMMGELRDDLSDTVNEIRDIQASNPSARFETASVSDGVIRNGFSKYPAGGATAEVEGAGSSRMTATRVGAGAVIAGPLGAAIGGMARKNTSKVYVVVNTVRGSFVVEGPAKKMKAALQFAAAVNRAGQLFAGQE